MAEMVINEEIELYQKMSKKIKLKKVWELLNAVPHSGQVGIIEAFDNDPTKNSYVVTLGRRSGKSFSTGLVVIRELLIPFSNTILLTPSYRTSYVLL